MSGGISLRAPSLGFAPASKGECAGNPLARVASTKANGVLSLCRTGGFTLIELLLVVALLGLLSGVAVSRLNRSVRARELSMAAKGIEDTLTAARAEAVRRGAKVRFTFNLRKREYWLSLQCAQGDRRGDFGAFDDGLLDARRTLPQGLALEGLSVPGHAANELVFEPTGLAEARELRLVDAAGGTVTIGISEWYEEISKTAPS